MDENLRSQAARVAKTVQPCRLQQAPLTLDPSKRPTTYSLFSRRGERNLGSVTKESEEECDKMLFNVFRYVSPENTRNPTNIPAFRSYFLNPLGKTVFRETFHPLYRLFAYRSECEPIQRRWERYELYSNRGQESIPSEH